MSQVANQSDHLPVYALEAEILRHEQVAMPTTHDFCSGLYARTLHIPANTVLTGAIHKKESFFVLRSGVLLVTTDDGPKQIYPGHMSISHKGTKRAGVAVTDCEVTTFHANPTNEQDADSLWDMYTDPAPQKMLEAVNHPTLEVIK